MSFPCPQWFLHYRSTVAWNTPMSVMKWNLRYFTSHSYVVCQYKGRVPLACGQLSWCNKMYEVNGSEVGEHHTCIHFMEYSLGELTKKQQSVTVQGYRYFSWSLTSTWYIFVPLLKSVWQTEIRVYNKALKAIPYLCTGITCVKTR